MAGGVGSGQVMSVASNCRVGFKSAAGGEAVRKMCGKVGQM